MRFSKAVAKMIGLTFLALALFVVTPFTSLSGCSRSPSRAPQTGNNTGQAGTPSPGSQPGGGVSLRVPPDIPEEIRGWADNSRHIFAGQSRDYGDLTYLLVTLGEKPSGGYEVRITSLGIKDGKFLVRCRFKEPSPGEPVTQAITYPYDLVAVPRLTAPVEFVAEGRELYIPGVRGANTVEPIVAQSRGIKVFSPAPGEQVKGEFKLRGIANVFEGTVNFRLKRDGKTTYEGFATGAMGDWGYFEATVPVRPDPGRGPRSAAATSLEVFTYSAKDGSVQDLIEIPLKTAL